jgi:hypothetical protein
MRAFPAFPTFPVLQVTEDIFAHDAPHFPLKGCFVSLFALHVHTFLAVKGSIGSLQVSFVAEAAEKLHWYRWLCV